MRLIIVSGMSGAGKSSALKTLEDYGYFCVDNLPISMLVHFAKLMMLPDANMEQVAVGIDIRSGQTLDSLSQALSEMDKRSYHYEILYLDCSTEVLVKRYKETRRTHPLDTFGSISDGIREERRRTAFLRERADYIIDTSHLLIRELRGQLTHIIVNEEAFQNLMVTITSFGYKFGIPSDADLVFDVRFLPNPYYIPELKALTGLDSPIQDYVLQFEEAHLFLEKLFDLIDFLLPNYIKEGKNSLVIAIGCTGGTHRSVTLANELYTHMESMDAVGVRITHRDLDKDSIRK